jgi:aspartate-semialdehyde dehydrogenase
MYYPVSGKPDRGRKKLVTIGIVGATGLVGTRMIEILQERSFPADRIIAFASERNQGRMLTVGNTTYAVEIINPASLAQGSILLGATSSAIAKQWIPSCVQCSAIVIDNSSAYRMDPDVPLVVPEVNPHAIENHCGIIANPNCSTIQLVVALAPLMSLSQIEWLSVSTYQAVSGAGGRALDQLDRELAGGVDGASGLYAGSVLTEIGLPAEDGFCFEETKLMKETMKILEREFPIFPSCARVPVRTGHIESVSIMFSEPVSREDAAKALSDAPSIRVFEKGLTPESVKNKDYVGVSRLRNHPREPRVLQFWVAADNLRKGAALNAVQIAEQLLLRS